MKRSMRSKENEVKGDEHPEREREQRSRKIDSSLEKDSSLMS